MSENNIAILFTISNFSVAVKPLFNNRFTVEEIYRLLQANDDEDLDRIEVYGGVPYTVLKSIPNMYLTIWQVSFGLKTHLTWIEME